MASTRTSVVLSSVYHSITINSGSQPGQGHPIGWVEVDNACLTIQSTEPAELRRLAEALIEAARQVEERQLSLTS